jgi:hypothetical protein
MEMVCVNNINKFGEVHLTIGKYYKIEAETKETYLVFNDLCEIKFYNKDRFKNKQKIARERLKDL